MSHDHASASQPGHSAGGGGGLFKFEKSFSGVVTPQPAPAAHGVGPTVDDKGYEGYLASLAHEPRLAADNVRLGERGADGVRRALLVLGLGGLVFTLLGAFIHSPQHAMASFKVGVFTALACCLGAMFWVMIFHAVNAHWSVTIRRVLEHIMAAIWVPLGLIVLMLLAELTYGPALGYTWFDLDEGSNVLLDHKRGYLNEGFLVARFIVYFVVWMGLARVLAGRSIEQDASGDRELSRRMRRLSCTGLLMFALTVPFAAFDFLMSLDFRFFSTMWGVYYFAGAAMSALALAAVIVAVIRSFGRMTGLVTKEHFHDLGKLLFGFNVFWAYIAFSQYFLIWYSNIPEETAWYIYRQQGGWQYLGMLLVIGHFVLPFLILISRKVKKSTLGLGVLGAYLLVMQVLDMVYIIRPMAYVDRPEAASFVSVWLDVVAVVGVLGVFGYCLVGRLVDHPLVPLKDPRLAKALRHANYV